MRSAALARRAGGDVAYSGRVRNLALVHARAAAHYMFVERLARRRGVTCRDLGYDIAVLAREHRQRTPLRKRLSAEQFQLVDQTPIDGEQLCVGGVLDQPVVEFQVEDVPSIELILCRGPIHAFDDRLEFLQLAGGRGLRESPADPLV